MGVDFQFYVWQGGERAFIGEASFFGVACVLGMFSGVRGSMVYGAVRFPGQV